MVDPMHVIHLENGRFSPGTLTNAGHIGPMLNRYLANPGGYPSGLVLHFHGGLVSFRAGAGLAQRLTPEYLQAGAYPVFFVWESGPLETIRNNFSEIANEKIFRKLAGKVLKFVIARLGSSLGGRGGPPGAATAEGTLEQWLEAGAEGSPVPFEDVRLTDPAGAARAAAQSDASLQFQVQADLELDFGFRQALAEVENGLKPAGDAATSRGAGYRGATTTRMTEEGLSQLTTGRDEGSRGVKSLAKAAVAIVALVRAVVGRMRTGRDHGLYATVVEEVLRRFYIDQLGRTLLWDRMKQDTADAFAADKPAGREPGGTMLLEALKARVQAGQAFPRITLVGHSAGSIYACRFLQHADAILPAGIGFHLCLLAPACTFSLFHETMTNHSGRVKEVRLFAMSDEVERKDAIAGVLYPHSLLYFVSGLLEDTVDEPLLGMQRYFTGTTVFNGPECQWARGYFQGNGQRTVWSVVDDGVGRSSASRRHGDFDNDAVTLASLRHLIQHGFV